jgi:hyperosmotically inducible protein
MRKPTYMAQALAIAALAALPAFPQAAPDNTKVNARDKRAGEVTADQQKMNKSDQETARRIRQMVVKDKSLSTYAHNAKIIVRDGTVTLKGPVRSQEEKDSLFRMATSVAGDSKVVNELDIAAPK